MLLHENAANSTLPQFFLLFKPRFIHRWVRSPQIHAQKGWHSIRVMDSCQSLPDDGTAIPCRTTCLLYAWLLEGQLTIGSWSYEWIEFKTCHATTWQYQWYSINCSPSDFLKANHVLGEHMWMNPTYFMIPYPGIPFGLTTCLNTVVGRPLLFELIILSSSFKARSLQRCATSSGWWLTYPSEKISKSVGMIIPNIWENKTCSKPPTSCYTMFGTLLLGSRNREKGDFTSKQHGFKQQTWGPRGRMFDRFLFTRRTNGFVLDTVDGCEILHH